jgi:hypothetical protein
MKIMITGTIAALVLGASIASSQTPSTQSQPATQPSGGQTQSGAQRQTADQRNQTNQNQTTTYRGYLRGSAASGWTISPVGDRAAASGSAAGAATAGAGAASAGGASTGGTVTYSVVAPSGSKVNLASLADQCVEIVGSLAPVTGTNSSADVHGAAGAAGQATASGNAGTRTTPGGNTTAGAAGNTSGNMSAHHNRTLNVTTIRAAAQSSCTQ